MNYIYYGKRNPFFKEEHLLNKNINNNKNNYNTFSESIHKERTNLETNEIKITKIKLKNAKISNRMFMIKESNQEIKDLFLKYHRNNKTKKRFTLPKIDEEDEEDEINII